MRLQLLWSKVGKKATTKERFFKYFGKRQEGCAIPIRHATRFATPLFPSVIKQRVPSFVVPMSYLIVSPQTDLFDLLESKRKEERNPQKVILRPIRASEMSTYRMLVTPLISRKYDEISERFAENILDIHKKGIDVNGILTTKKKVLGVISQDGNLLGFTTVTFKIGGSMKTGPSILLSQYRGKGFGLALRTSLVVYAKKHNIRKLYCTCPDNDNDLTLHFIRSGYNVEAHLASHYATSHGELVFGRLLRSNMKQRTTPISRSKRVLLTQPPVAFDRKVIAKSLTTGFAANWVGISMRTAQALLDKALLASGLTYEEKPVSMIVCKDIEECAAFGLLIHKRGGASKLLLWTTSHHVESLKNLIKEIMAIARKDQRKKVYCLHPWSDLFVIGHLKACGFQCEGILREPYKQGKDLMVLSKTVSQTRITSKSHRLE